MGVLAIRSLYYFMVHTGAPDFGKLPGSQATSSVPCIWIRSVYRQGEVHLQDVVPSGQMGTRRLKMAPKTYRMWSLGRNALRVES